MENSTAILLIKALDCLSARSVVTAENIANANTPNYRPLRLSFEKALADAAGKGDEAVSQVTPQVERIPAGTPVICPSRCSASAATPLPEGVALS